MFSMIILVLNAKQMKKVASYVGIIRKLFVWFVKKIMN